MIGWTGQYYRTSIAMCKGISLEEEHFQTLECDARRGGHKGVKYEKEKDPPGDIHSIFHVLCGMRQFAERK